MDDLTKAIAEKIQGVRAILESGDDTSGHLPVVNILANRIATAFGEQYPTFDRDRFRQACGFEYDSRGRRY
jgi:hypothetical protein